MAIKPVSGEVKSQDINDNLSYLDSKLDQVNGGPLGSLESVAELNQKYPNGANGFFIIDGHMYFWENNKWVDKGVYQAKGLAENSVGNKEIIDESITANKTTFVKKIGFEYSDFSDLYAVFTGSNTQIVESVNKSNGCFYFKVEDEQEIIINVKTIPRFLYIGSTIDEPSDDVNVQNVVTIADGGAIYDDSKVYNYKVPLNCKYVIIRCWNNGDSYSFEDTKKFFRIFDSRYPNYNSILDDNVLISVKNDFIEDESLSADKIKGLTEVMNSVKSRADHNNYKRKYVEINNFKKIELEDFIQIKLSFEPSELKSEKCVRVFKNNLEIPFQFDKVENENFSKLTDETYYPDGSVRACTIWLTDTIDINKNRYEVRLYDNEQNYKFTEQIKVHNFDTIMNIKENDNVYEFDNQNLNLEKINTKMFSDDSRTKIGGSTLRLKTFDILENKVSGSGVIFKDVTRILKYKDEVLFKQIYRIFVNGRIEVTLKSLVLKNTNEGYIESVYNGFNTISGDVTVSEIGEHFYTMKNGSATYGVSPIFTNGNVQRDSTTLPTYPTKIYTSFNSSVNTILVGWDYFGSKTYPIKEGTFFSSKYTVDLSKNENTKLNQYVPIVGYAVGKTENKVTEQFINEVCLHIDHLKDYVIEKSNLDYFNLSLPYITLYEYKYKNIRSIDDVINSFDKVFNAKFSGETVTTFMSDYKNGLGIHISGRFIQVSYLIYKELIELNDDRSQRFKNITCNYGEFISDIWKDNNDIPMVYQKGVTNNGRAIALNCMAMSLQLEDDSTISNSFFGLSNLIDQAVRVNTILPDGNLSTNRYLHYSAFAMYELAKASLVLDVQIPNLLSYTNNLVDCSHSTGQLKDMTYCCSDSRRGLGHTYSYSIAVLFLKGNAGEKNLALNLLKWLTSQDLPFGEQVFPLDDYMYNSSQKYDGALPFEMISLVEVLMGR